MAGHGQLGAAIEFKSQVGPSFGNNFNNRSEEAIGSATDVWAAYREGAFRPSPRPFLGYLMLLEDCAASQAGWSGSGAWLAETVAPLPDAPGPKGDWPDNLDLNAHFALPTH